MKKENFERVSLHSDDSNEDVVNTIKMFAAFSSLSIRLRIRDIKKGKKKRNELLKKYKGSIISPTNKDVQFVGFHDDNVVVSVMDGTKLSYALVSEINKRIGLKIYNI